MADPAAPRIPRAVAIGAVTAGVAIAGPPVGVLWAFVAPPVHGVIALTRAGDRVRTYLGDEADHLFVAPFLVLGLLGVLGAVAVALVWQWRAHRGPGMVVGLSVGLGIAAALAALVGAEMVHHRYGAVDVDAAPVTPEHRVSYFAEAPPVFFGHAPWQVAATLLTAAATAALGYALCAVWAVRDDLGGYPAVDPAVRPIADLPAGSGIDVTSGGNALPRP